MLVQVPLVVTSCDDYQSQITASAVLFWQSSVYYFPREHLVTGQPPVSPLSEDLTACQNVSIEADDMQVRLPVAHFLHCTVGFLVELKFGCL